MERITRIEAKAIGLKRYFTAYPCKRGHLTEQYVSNGNCMACASDRARKWEAANPEKRREQARKWQAANPEKVRERKRKARAANPEKHRKRARKARAADPERYREYGRKSRAANRKKIRERAREARAANPEKFREQVRKWQAANRKKIRERARKDRAANPEKFREQQRKARAANPEKCRKQDRKRYAANPEKFRERQRKRSRTPLGQLRRFARHTFSRLAIGHLGHSRQEYIAYSPEEFIAHLEATLPPGLTHDEARQMGYHVDHIVPLALIAAALPGYEDIKKRMAVDLENLQMIPGTENMSKSAEVCMNDEQEKVFHYLCTKYDVIDAMLAEVIPYSVTHAPLARLN